MKVPQLTLKRSTSTVWVSYLRYKCCRAPFLPICPVRYIPGDINRNTVPHTSPDLHLSAHTPVDAETHQTYVHTPMQQATQLTDRGYLQGIWSLSWLRVCALSFLRYVIRLCCRWENRVCAHTPNPKTRSYELMINNYTCHNYKLKQNISGHPESSTTHLWLRRWWAVLFGRDRKWFLFPLPDTFDLGRRFLPWETHSKTHFKTQHGQTHVLGIYFCCGFTLGFFRQFPLIIRFLFPPPRCSDSSIIWLCLLTRKKTPKALNTKSN